jgi:uncharacterized membrane protein YdjX (TVP38/TMEM64 family)
VEIPLAFLIVFIGESMLRENAGLFIVLMIILLGLLVWELRNARRMRRS